MVYVDTSVIVKLYIKEEYSRDTSNWLRENNEALPLTSFHELELINAGRARRIENTDIVPSNLSFGKPESELLLTMRNYKLA